MKTVGIVLAGGLSRRFGSPKAFARLEAKYFYERAVEAYEPFCEEVVVVTRQELVDRFGKMNKYDYGHDEVCRTRSACRNFVSDGISGSGLLRRFAL